MKPAKKEGGAPDGPTSANMERMGGGSAPKTITLSGTGGPHPHLNDQKDFKPVDGAIRAAGGPEAWLGGGRKAGEAKVMCSISADSDYLGARVALSPDASQLVGARSVDSDKAVTIYEPTNASVRKVLTGLPWMVICVAVDGMHIACGGYGGGIYMWTTEGAPLGEMPKEHRDHVRGVALLGDLLASASSDKTAKLWSVSARTCTATLSEHTGAVYCVAVTKEAIATGSAEYSARLWPVGGGASLHTLSHPNAVLAVAMANDVLVTSCGDRVVRTFAVSTGQRTRELRGHTDRVSAVALSGPMVVSGGWDKVVKVWALTGEASTECVTTLVTGQRYGLFGVVAGPDFVASQPWGSSELIVWRP